MIVDNWYYIVSGQLTAMLLLRSPTGHDITANYADRTFSTGH
ncbi:hypothetical protein [Microcoleus sp. B4-D4]